MKKLLLISAILLFSFDLFAVPKPKVGHRVQLQGTHSLGTHDQKASRTIEIVSYNKRTRTFTISDITKYEDGTLNDQSYKQSSNYLEKYYRDVAATVNFCASIGGQNDTLHFPQGSIYTCHFLRRPENGETHTWFSDVTPFGLIKSIKMNYPRGEVLNLLLSDFNW